MGMTPNETKQPRARRSAARRAGIAFMGLVAVWLTGAGTYQVLKANLWPEIVPTQFECRPGARALLQTLESARDRAATQTLSERQALTHFRSDLEPVWKQANAIRQVCSAVQDHSALKALSALQRLRYAEERSIRLSAADLTKLRRSTPRLIQSLESPQK